MPVQDNGLYDLSKTGRWATSLLLVLIVAEFLFAGHTLLFLNYLSQFQQGLNPDPTTVDLVGGITGILYAVVFFSCLIVSGMWIYRAAYNALQFSSNEEIKPGWAVGWYFVPIANLWMPYQALKRVWVESVKAEPGGFFGWWWGAWILSNILANLSFRSWNNATMAEQMQTASYIDLATFPLGLVSAYLFRKVILDLTEAQRPIYEGTGQAAVFE